MILEFGRILAALRGVSKRPMPPCETGAFPQLRNLILDVMAEGRRKNIINLLFEVELGWARDSMAKIEAETGERISLTAWVTKCLADTIATDRRVQAYRKGRRQVVMFDDVDVTLMVERDIDGAWMPVPQIIRAANRKSLLEIHRELMDAKQDSNRPAGSLTALERRFVSMPWIFRRLAWFFIRRDPVLFKEVMGTVGVTSLGMFTRGAAILLPITPMTLTVAIGGISKQVALEGGQAVEREVLHLNVGADHDVVDGAPLMRFAERLRQRIRGD